MALDFVNKKIASPLLLRLVTLLFGILLVMWLPYEDTQVDWLVLFSCGMALLAVAWFLWSFSRKRRLTWWIFPLTGLAGGVFVVMDALALMAFKSGLHGHQAPDFNPDQVTAILRSIPAWMLGGCLLGLGISIWKIAK